MEGYKVVITPEARWAIESIYKYYYSWVSQQMAENINAGIRRDINLLATQPYLGKLETKGNSSFYVFISVNYKIIYTVNETVLQVIIIEIFDSRQDPSKLNP